MINTEKCGFIMTKGTGLLYTAALSFLLDHFFLLFSITYFAVS